MISKNKCPPVVGSLRYLSDISAQLQGLNGDGIGDLRGIAEKLPYLADTLGVDTIWISPFFTSPMKDFGYDVADFQDCDPIFGTLAEAERLIESIHDRGMRVIFDYVSNHSSDRHEWFLDSRSSRESAKRDWYFWRDPGPDGGPPNNWLSVFGGPAWTFDEATGQYYLHSFLASQPDLNWRNPELREAMHGVLKFWMDRGVDGFRIDAAHFVGKDEELRDNPPAPPGSLHMHRPMGEYDHQLHVYDKGTGIRPRGLPGHPGIRRSALVSRTRAPYDRRDAYL
ncbi:MAG: alpha-amylase family glycosyl hydrolase [Thermomicrobiales bacterium]